MKFLRLLKPTVFSICLWLSVVAVFAIVLLAWNRCGRAGAPTSPAGTAPTTPLRKTQIDGRFGQFVPLTGWSCRIGPGNPIALWFEGSEATRPSAVVVVAEDGTTRILDPNDCLLAH